jgi:subtilisin family serine protease
MSRSFTFKAFCSIVITLTLLLAPFAVQAQGASPEAALITPQSGEVIPDEYIVVFKSNAATVSADAVTASVEALGGQVTAVYGAVLNGYAARLPKAALAAVRSDPAVAYVAADAMIYLEPNPDEVSTDAVQTPATWGLDRIDQRSLPLNNQYTYVRTGAGVHAYIIDTGIRSTHTQFGARANKVADFVGDGRAGNDCNGHGTHVAGTIGGSTYGVAKAVRLHAVRVFGCTGGAPWSRIISALNWVGLHRIRPAVANLSLGGGAYAPVDSAINGLIAKNVVVVVAAGNDNANACLYSPARVPAAITVASTYYTDARSYFSNKGACVDIFAPGSYITSAWYTSNTATNTISGTSMATPHVAGAVALYLQAHPTATQLTVRNALVTASTKNKVTDPGGSPNRLLYSLVP